MISGRVVKFTKDRGFGFVQPDDGGQDVFLHIAELAVAADARKLRVGQVVTFRREDGDKGPKALEVTVGRHPPDGISEDDGMSDVLSRTELHTELDIVLDRAMRGAKARIKEDLTVLCQGHGWVDG